MLILNEKQIGERILNEKPVEIGRSKRLPSFSDRIAEKSGDLRDSPQRVYLQIWSYGPSSFDADYDFDFDSLKFFNRSTREQEMKRVEIEG